MFPDYVFRWYREINVYDQILQAVAAEMAKIHGDAEATRFVHRNSSVFAPLCIISHLTRSTLEGREKYGRFSPEQLTELDTACATKRNHLVATLAYKIRYDSMPLF